MQEQGVTYEVYVDGEPMNASGWAVEDGTLHVRRRGVVVASFAAGQWKHVCLVAHTTTAEPAYDLA